MIPRSPPGRRRLRDLVEEELQVGDAERAAGGNDDVVVLARQREEVQILALQADAIAVGREPRAQALETAWVRLHDVEHLAAAGAHPRLGFILAVAAQQQRARRTDRAPRAPRWRRAADRR
jgi:hypothetical protein